MARQERRSYRELAVCGGAEDGDDAAMVMLVVRLA